MEDEGVSLVPGVRHDSDRDRRLCEDGTEFSGGLTIDSSEVSSRRLAHAGMGEDELPLTIKIVAQLDDGGADLICLDAIGECGGVGVYSFKSPGVILRRLLCDGLASKDSDVSLRFPLRESDYKLTIIVIDEERHLGDLSIKSTSISSSGVMSDALVCADEGIDDVDGR